MYEGAGLGQLFPLNADGNNLGALPDQRPAAGFAVEAKAISAFPQRLSVNAESR